MMSSQDVTSALAKDREYIGNRWISVVSSNLENMERDINKEGEGERGEEGQG